jgi:DNA-binding response OmpR family regulator
MHRERRAGELEFLPKPFSASELRERVAALTGVGQSSQPSR